MLRLERKGAGEQLCRCGRCTDSSEMATNCGPRPRDNARWSARHATFSPGALHRGLPDLRGTCVCQGRFASPRPRTASGSALTTANALLPNVYGFLPSRCHGEVRRLGFRGQQARGPCLGRSANVATAGELTQKITARLAQSPYRHVDAGSCNGCESELQA